MKRNMIVPLAIAAASIFVVSSAQAQGIPDAVPCVVSINGAQFFVPQQPGMISAWAQTQFWNGYPTITYGQMYFQLSPLLRRFTSFHECGHASTGNPDEFAANCYALDNGNFSCAQISVIRKFYQSRGPVAPQYGGTGANFWAGTLAQCPQYSNC